MNPFPDLYSMQQFDTLIVGQGIAGSLLAHQLYRRRRSFIVIDAGHSNSASRVAAGMFTPISGKRKTLLPGILDQIKHAIKSYKAIEELLQVAILHLQNVYEIPGNEQEYATLLKRSITPEYQQLFVQNAPPIPWLDNKVAYSVITCSGWVDCALLTKSYREWLLEKQCLREASFQYGSLKKTAAGFCYEDFQFTNLVFCEGYRAAANPFFNEEAIVPCKGDIIDIHCTGLDTLNILKKNGYYLLPSGGAVARVGATHQWHTADETLFQADCAELQSAASEILNGLYFDAIRHQAAIRATTANREVIAKAHPYIPGMYMLNGLGSKGVLHAPWYASKLLDLICAGE